MHNVQSFSLIAQSSTMRAILSRLEAIAASDHSVLLIGETGVGKELFADYIHRLSPRALQPMVKVGLSALPHELLESELFGHEKGAYTNASAEKPGIFELAGGGSIFLDDIDDVPLDTQAKLLRVLESREMMRIGGTVSIPVDVRVMSASKVDLKELVERRLFRADLFYRLNVVPVVIPPLRLRREDIPLLVDHFLRRFAKHSSIGISPEALEHLMTYPWPGNVRELRNVIQRITLFASGEIQAADLPPEIRSDHPIDTIIKACRQCFSRDGMTLDQVVSCLEVNLLQQALEASSGNKAQAAKDLNMSVSTFRDRLRKYRLDNGNGQ